jgi:hypothetical protein
MGLRDDYELVDDYYASECYQWSVVGVFRRVSDDALFWSSQGGCSCFGPWDHTPDLQPFNDQTFGKFSEAVMWMAVLRPDAHEWITKMAALVRPN